MRECNVPLKEAGRLFSVGAGCEEGEGVKTKAAATYTLCALDTGPSRLRSGKALTFPASLKPENDLDLGRVVPTCGTKFGSEIGAKVALLSAFSSCTPGSIIANRRDSLSDEVLVGSALVFGLVSFALAGGGAPKRGPTAKGAAELLRIRAKTVAERVDGAGGGARACNGGSGSMENIICTGPALEFKSGSQRAYSVTGSLRTPAPEPREILMR